MIQTHADSSRKINWFLIASASLFALSLSPAAWAKDKPRRPMPTSVNNTTTPHEEDHASSVDSPDSTPHPSSHARFGLGYATLNSFGGGNSALSTWIDLAGGNHVQALFAIGATTPTIEFGLGGFFKHDISSFENAAFHVGGGLGLGAINVGTKGQFFMNLQALGGFHFHFSDLRNLLFSIDGGPSVFITDGATSFNIGSLSPFFGMSIHYMF